MFAHVSCTMGAIKEPCVCAHAHHMHATFAQEMRRDKLHNYARDATYMDEHMTFRNACMCICASVHLQMRKAWTGIAAHTHTRRHACVCLGLRLYGCTCTDTHAHACTRMCKHVSFNVVCSESSSHFRTPKQTNSNEACAPSQMKLFEVIPTFEIVHAPSAWNVTRVGYL